MIVKGGVFDKITDNKVLADLCGAKWIKKNENSGIWFPILGKEENPEGSNLYKTIQSEPGTLQYAMCVN